MAGRRRDESTNVERAVEQTYRVSKGWIQDPRKRAHRARSSYEATVIRKRKVSETRSRQCVDATTTYAIVGHEHLRGVDAQRSSFLDDVALEGKLLAVGPEAVGVGRRVANGCQKRKASE